MPVGVAAEAVSGPLMLIDIEVGVVVGADIIELMSIVPGIVAGVEGGA